MNSSNVIPFTHELKSLPTSLYSAQGDQIYFGGIYPHVLTKTQNKKLQTITFKLFKCNQKEDFLEFNSKRNLNIQFLEQNRILFTTDDYFEVKKIDMSKIDKLELTSEFKITFNQLEKSKIGEKYTTKSGRTIVNRLDLQMERDPIQSYFIYDEVDLIAILKSGIVYIYRYSTGNPVRQFKLKEYKENHHHSILLDDFNLIHLSSDENHQQKTNCYELKFK